MCCAQHHFLLVICLACLHLEHAIGGHYKLGPLYMSKPGLRPAALDHNRCVHPISAFAYTHLGCSHLVSLWLCGWAEFR